MTRIKVLSLLLLAVAVLLAPATAGAASRDHANVLPESMAGPVTSAHQATISGAMNGPGWVQSYTAKCSQRGALKVEIRDCCIPGDHFEASARSWDSRPTTVRAMASGSTSVYRTVILTSFGAQPLHALVNIRYMHGINVFPAGFSVRLTCIPSTSTLTWTDQGQVCDTSK